MKNYQGNSSSMRLQSVLIFPTIIMLFCSTIAKGYGISHNNQPGLANDTIPAKGLVINQVNGGDILSVPDVSNVKDVQEVTNSKAEFPGGSREWMRFMNRTFRYPADAMNKNIQGQVIIKFMVDEKGRLKNIEAVTGPKQLQQEAIRVIRESGRWTPAKENGRPVKSEKEQAITFKLESPDTTTPVAKSSMPAIEPEIAPTFPGGAGPWMQYLNRTFRYPETAQRNGIQGTVVVQFIVDIDGTVSDVEAVSGPTGGGLREEATRVIKKSGKWTPALQNGTPVKCYKKQPITFMLESN